MFEIENFIVRCGRITKEAAKKIYGYDGSELAAE